MIVPFGKLFIAFPSGMRLWLFAYSGLTQQAKNFAGDHQILWSSREGLNALLDILGLRPLPESNDNP